MSLLLDIWFGFAVLTAGAIAFSIFYLGPVALVVGGAVYLTKKLQNKSSGDTNEASEK